MLSALRVSAFSISSAEASFISVSISGWYQLQGDRPVVVQQNRYAAYGRQFRRLTAGMSGHELQRIRGILQSVKNDFAANS